MSDVIVTIEINGIKKELKQSDVIACKSEEEAQTLFKALECSKFTWCTGNDLVGSDSYMNHDREEGRGYCIDKNGLSHSNINWFKNNFDYENNDKSYNVMYFDELFTPQLTIDELWKVIKEIFTEDGMEFDEMLDCFGKHYYDEIIENNTPQSLVLKYNTWKKSEEDVKIEVGDIFEYSDNEEENKEKYIILSIDGEECNVMWEDFTKSNYDKDFVLEDKKVGHKDITDLFNL